MPWAKRSRPQRDLTTIHPAAAAIDIGATMHVAAVGPDRDTEPVRTFRTFTEDLYRLADWFARCGIKTIVMESTGVYWIPVFEILEQRGFEVMVVNARDAKHVPGRKTDVNNAEWLQRLHAYGLLRASFRPQAEVAGLRAYLRQRERLLDYAATHIQHMQKALMQMNRKRCGVGTLRFALESNLYSGFPSDDGVAAGVLPAEQGQWRWWD